MQRNKKTISGYACTVTYETYGTGIRKNIADERISANM